MSSNHDACVAFNEKVAAVCLDVFAGVEKRLSAKIETLDAFLSRARPSCCGGARGADGGVDRAAAMLSRVGPSDSMYVCHHGGGCS